MEAQQHNNMWTNTADTDQGTLQTSSVVVTAAHNQQTLLLIKLFSETVYLVIESQYLFDLLWN